MFMVILTLASCQKQTSTKNLDEIDTTVKIKERKFYDHKLGFENVNLQSLNELAIKNIDSLEAFANDPYLLKFREFSSSAQLFYYKIIDTTQYNSLIYYQRGEYEQSFDIVNFDKDNNIIDSHQLVATYGDAEYLIFSNIEVKNDSTLFKIEFESHFTDYDSLTGISIEVLDKEINLVLNLKADGRIVIDTIR